MVLFLNTQNNHLRGQVVSMTYPWRNDDRLEAIEDGLDGDGGVHAAEVHHRVGDGRRSVVERLDQEREACSTQLPSATRSSIAPVCE